MKYRSAKGFSLIELMIVVAIIGVLATIATTSYQDSVRKARRGDAQAALMELAQLMERRFTEFNTFLNADASQPVLGTDIGFATSPNTGSAVYYNLSFNGAVTATAFTLQAVPVGPQQKDTLCKDLRLSSTGLKTINGGTGSAADCWSR